jgi:hypothetical protein
MEDAVNVSTAADSGDIVVAGAGYAGLHVALRLTARLRNNPGVELTWSTGMITTRCSLSCPGSRAAPAPPTRCASRSRICWPSGSVSSDRDQWFRPDGPTAAHRRWADRL